MTTNLTRSVGRSDTNRKITISHLTKERILEMDYVLNCFINNY